MRILITGCLGHISSYLIRNLPENWKIIGYDNLLTQRYTSLFNLPRSIEFYDLGFEKINKDKLKNIDCVIHLASITDATNASKENIQKINIDETKNFIDLCFDVCPKFVMASTTSVYGVSKDIVYEDDETYINPQSFYAESKYITEQYIKQKHSKHTSYIIMRFGTVTGISNGMRFHTACNKFAYDAVFHRKLKIWKQNYHMVRPYLTLDDLNDSIIHCINRPNIWNQIYNVVTDNIELSKIVKEIEKYINVEKEWVDTPLLNQYSYIVSADKLQKTGFHFSGNVYRCISDTIHLLSGI